jgi:hypothetical protein
MQFPGLNDLSPFFLDERSGSILTIKPLTRVVFMTIVRRNKNLSGENMKTLSLIALSLVLVSSAHAEAAKYIVESLVCVGKINQQPAGMHDDYVQMVLKVTSFRSMRKDGSLADSTETGIEYFNKNAKVNRYVTSFGEVFYSAPLYRFGNKVKNVDGDLNLTITEGAEKTLGSMKLVGTYGRKESVVGSYFYNLDCSANVVKKSTRIDDLTAGN